LDNPRPDAVSKIIVDATEGAAGGVRAAPAPTAAHDSPQARLDQVG